MYDLLKADLLIMPAWLEASLEAYNVQPKDIKTTDDLESILSGEDVRFYLKQVSALVTAVNSAGPSDSPLSTLFSSLRILHTNNHMPISSASQTQDYVKINTLYGTEFARHDFFGKMNMLSFLPRVMQATLNEDVKVDPYVEYVSPDLFVLKFGLGLYPEHVLGEGYPERAKVFTSNTLECLMGTYGFDKISRTKLFDLYTLIP